MKSELPRGVMLNAYPDSIGGTLSDIVSMLSKPELKDVFSLFYVLPTFFNSDLDRGFSVIDYDLNRDMVSREDLAALEGLGVKLKFDLVLNHLSVGSPQFQDILRHGEKSEYKDFFVDWNDFWRDNGKMDEDGCIVPRDECLQKLFMRKPGLPILKVLFPDGSERPYWNTFYQEINYHPVKAEDFSGIDGLQPEEIEEIIVPVVNAAVKARANISGINLGRYTEFKDSIVAVVEHKRSYLGQMDLNAGSEKVWEFYDQTLRKLRDYGALVVRLDAFAYLHKEPGMTNFFNKPGTWDYLGRLQEIADKYDLLLLPEIHSEYGTGLHAEMSGAGYPIYDFFFPGLVIDALERGRNEALLRWVGEILGSGIKTVNMLGCHDGIPMLDLVGKEIDGVMHPGLLADDHINAAMQTVVDRGGRVKNLYGPDGKKISYYQVNATFFSALGEDERKFLLARAIQIFMPGVPQVWYLDLFAGRNDYAAADKGGTGGHKEINRTNLTPADVDRGLEEDIVRNQLRLLRLRNTSPAFDGQLEVGHTDQHRLELTWRSDEGSVASLSADLRGHGFEIKHRRAGGPEELMRFE